MSSQPVFFGHKKCQWINTFLYFPSYGLLITYLHLSACWLFGLADAQAQHLNCKFFIAHRLANLPLTKIEDSKLALFFFTHVEQEKRIGYHKQKSQYQGPNLLLLICSTALHKKIFCFTSADTGHLSFCQREKWKERVKGSKETERVKQIELGRAISTVLRPVKKIRQMKLKCTLDALKRPEETQSAPASVDVLLAQKESRSPLANYRNAVMLSTVNGQTWLARHSSSLEVVDANKCLMRPEIPFILSLWHYATDSFDNNRS